MKISVKNVEFKYDGVPALENVTLEIKEGEIIGLVGPNGSGKTTLLKCLNKILEPSTGAIFFDQTKLERISRQQIAKNAGYVPQFEQKNFPTTIFNTILMGRKPYINWRPSKQDLEITSQVIEKLGLKELAMRDINEISGGQKQKVLIGRALAQKPKILILDEPTNNLDLKHELEILNLIHQQSQEKISVIMSLHDLNLAAKYSDKIIMLKNGKIFEVGGPEIVNSKNIEKVYGVKASIRKHGKTNLVVPEEPISEAKNDEQRK